MHFLTRRIVPLLARYAAVLLVVGVVTLLLAPLQGYLAAQVVALIYLLPVILTTFLWGLTPGILAGLASFLLYNYFFLPPYHTLAVHQTQDLITLFVFLVVAVIISQLIGQARAGVRLAQSREWEATQMYTLISALAGEPEIAGVGRLLARRALETFGGSRVEVCIESRTGGEALTVAEGEHATGDPAIRCAMETARRAEGEIWLWLNRPVLTDEENRLLNTFASQGALAIERIRLSQSETRARILEETDKAKSSLLSSVSHELRTPLSVIKASASSLATDMVSWDSADRHELLTTIEEETDRLNFLVGNLLDMTRIEAGALKPRRQWNSLAEIANGAAARMSKALKDYRVEMAFPPGLPLIPVDYVLIEQVFTNLLSNSGKFAPPGSLIRVWAEQEGDLVHARVSNQSPPIPEQDLERIFEKFNRVTAADGVTGTGLGLSICKGIIEAHEGRLWAENAPGADKQPGCIVFHFTLPARLGGYAPEVPVEG